MSERTYIVKDTRWERSEGLPSYIIDGSATTYDPSKARRFSTFRDAKQAAKNWCKMMDYESSIWVTVMVSPYAAPIRRKPASEQMSALCQSPIGQAAVAKMEGGSK